MQTRVVVRDNRVVIVIELSPGFRAMGAVEQRRMIEEGLAEALDRLTSTAAGLEIGPLVPA